MDKTVIVISNSSYEVECFTFFQPLAFNYVSAIVLVDVIRYSSLSQKIIFSKKFIPQSFTNFTESLDSFKDYSIEQIAPFKKNKKTPNCLLQEEILFDLTTKQFQVSSQFPIIKRSGN